MLKVLIKKQMAEVFRSYFYNQKKKQMRTKGGIAMMFALFILLIVGLIGGMFTALAIALCGGLTGAGIGWLYFALMSGIAITFGTLGSVFNTYSGLYLPKDNDLLLSMPIPVRTIIVSRLVNVYLLGLMYSGVAMLPTLIVYWVTAGVTAANLFCGLVLFLIVTLIVLILSCLLGWIVAKISLKLKNKSFVTVLISLAFIGLYYFLYFKAQDLIRELLLNAAVYGANIKSSAYVLYLFGSVGEGDLLATAIFSAATAVLLALTMLVLSRGFLKLATASGSTKKALYREKTVKQKSAFGALLSKEFARLASSPNYMLNCTLGVLLLPAVGVLLLIKGADILPVIGMVFTGKAGCAGLLVCASLMLVATMCDTAAPSVSLEGKSIWIPQSMPVRAQSVLMAKASVQLILTAVPMLFAGICAAAVVQGDAAERIMICLAPLSFSVFSALFGTFLSVKNPVLEWTTETVPIKQSGAVVIAMFGGWGIVALFAVPYFFFGYRLGLTLYLLIWTVVYAAVSVVLYRWLNTKGADAFSRL